MTGLVASAATGGDEIELEDLAVGAHAGEPRREGRDFGTLVHAVLERIDFNRPADARRIAEFLAPDFIGPHPERAAADAAAMVERFLETQLAKRIATAAVVRRELEFWLPWPPGEGHALRGAAPSLALPARGRRSDGTKRGLYLHGYLDCLMQDAEGRWRLIDYKTNRVAPARVNPVVEQYRVQLLAYKLACEEALGEPLAECLLVLLAPGVVQPLVWDDAARRRGIDAITRAIQSLRACPVISP
jgi:ATP-dependent helicase/nuclease subunit A